MLRILYQVTTRHRTPVSITALFAQRDEVPKLVETVEALLIVVRCRESLLTPTVGVEHDRRQQSRLNHFGQAAPAHVNVNAAPGNRHILGVIGKRIADVADNITQNRRRKR